MAPYCVVGVVLTMLSSAGGAKLDGPMLVMLTILSSAGGAKLDGPMPAREMPRRGDGPLHRLQWALAGRGRAENPGSVGRLHKPTETQVVRLVLTGGPCAGKSSSLSRLVEAAKREGFDVYAAPECATMVFNCGFSFPEPDDPMAKEKVLAFQKALFKLQLQLERSMTLMAASTGRPSILIFDRGLMDGKGYCTDEAWSQLLDDVAHEGRDVVLLGKPITEEYILQRYDAIIHMVTAADGAAGFYRHGETVDDTGNYVWRRETPDEAVELDRRTQSCWAEHPRHVVVRNPVLPPGADGLDGFRQKVDMAVDAVLEIARMAHPQEAVA